MCSRRLLDLCEVPLLVVLIFVLLTVAQVDLPTHLDFGQLYRSLSDLRSGGHLYQISDEALALNATQPSLRGNIPFPGPPWYAALASPLRLLSEQSAAKAWMAISIGLLFGTVKLLLPTFSLRSQVAVFLLVLMSAPAQGHLIVGQFTIPAVLGAAVAARGLRISSAYLTALGLALTTLRPHLGIPLIGAIMLWLLVQRSGSFLSPHLQRCESSHDSASTPYERTFGCKVCLLLLIMCGFLLALSFAIDPESLTRYPAYLKLLNSLPSNQICDTCSSIPIVTERLLPNGGTVWAGRFIVGAVVGLLLVLLPLFKKASGELYLASITCAVVLAAPYIRNYDFVLLIVPAAILLNTLSSVARTQHTQRLSLLLTATYTIAAILPYLLARSTQGETLWLAPALLYLGAYSSIKTVN